MIWQPFNQCRWLRAILLGAILVLGPSFADAVSLQWDRNPETNIVGYRVYVGRVSRVYDSVLDMGNSTSASVPTSPGITYFAVTAYDSAGLESGFSSEVTYSDGSVNFPPEANPDAYFTIRDASLTVSPANGVLANDSDANGSAISATLVSTVSHGTLVLNADGSFIYTPAANYTGPDSFTYRCTDGASNSPVATVIITVSLPPTTNTPPVANHDTYSAQKNTALTVSAAAGVLANDTDANGNPLSVSFSTTPALGSLTLNANGSFTYTPPANYTGAATFTYRTSDGIAESATASVTINITGSTTTNTTPVAYSDGYSVNKNNTLNVSATTGVLANDTDAESDPLTALFVSGASYGSVTLNADGSFTYTPNANFTGNDTFQYRASDGSSNSLPTIVVIHVTSPTENRPPNPVADTYTTAKDTPLEVPSNIGVLANDSDPDGNAMSVLQHGSPTRGSVLLYSDGSFTYTPNAGATGTDSFGYRVVDGIAVSSPVTVNIIITGDVTTNNAPVANNNSYVTTKAVALSVAAPGLLANDTDADGNPLTAVLVTGPANGTLSLNANGSFTYTPSATFVGTDSFTYRANDGTTNSSTATVSITVNPPPNSAPVANGNSYSTTKAVALTVSAPGILANDTDADSNPLTAVLVTGPANGTLSLNANGSFTYTPSATFVGTDSFTYRANDGTTNSAAATVSITVNPPPNNAPVANGNSYSTTKAVALTVSAPGILANDTDADSNPLTAVLASGPANGTLTLNANGSFTYTPSATFVGTDSFTYRANDGTTNSAAATVSITVNPPPNNAPVANGNSYSTTKAIALTVSAPGVLGNDTDADSNPLTAVLATGPANGTLSLNANGSFTYTPSATFVGTDSFTYRANDGTTNSATATVSITVNPPPNSAPVANGNSYSTTKAVALTVSAPGILANDTDADSNPLTAVLVTGPANGTLTLNANGSFTYTPSATFVGTDSFTYRANDGTTNSAAATVSITVNPPPNNAPVANGNSYSTTKAIALTVSAPGVLGNDTDADSNPLTAVLASGPANGTLSLNANGSFTYTPSATFVGTDSFTYRANDGTTNSAAATVSITVNPPPNNAPVANNNSYSTTKAVALTVSAPGILANDTDADSNPLTAVLATGPANGTLSLNANGSFTYTPSATFVGTDSFTYRANDGTTNSAAATVSITVNPPPNSAPVANGNSYSTTKAVALTVSAPGILANDTDADSNPLTAVLVTGPANGTLTLNANGSFTYTPSATFVGTDSFTYRANDGTTNSAAATVSITVNPPPNNAPVANGNSYSTTKAIALTVSAPGVLGNDTDADSNPLTAVLATGPANGTLSLNANGSFTYTPSATFVGTDSFTYRANDGTTNSATATVSITVNPPPNSAPVANGNSYSTTKAVALTVSAPGILANDTDADSNPLTAVLVTGPANGTLTLNANGSFTYTPSATFVGTDSFTYRANDGTTNSAAATVSITVNPPPNNAPVANGNSYSTTKAIALTVSAPGVLGNDTDADSNPLTAVLASGPANGTLSLNANGSFTYTPSATFVGTDSFTYRANDGTTNSAAATVSITVNPPPNNAPVANNNSYSTTKAVALTVSAPGILANDTDADSNPLTAVLATGPANGTLSLNANGSFTYTPSATFVGTDSFTYRANDGTTNSAAATVSITVNPPPNSAPVANGNSYSTTKAVALTVSAPGILANDTDADSNPLTAVLVTGPANGTLTLNANGSFTYTPSATFVGTDSFTYRANDGTTNSAAATVSITVNPPPNNAPVANGNSYSTTKAIALTVSAPGVLGNDTDADSNPLTAVLASGPANGTLSLNANGSFTYTPSATFVGTDSFTYRANDGTTNSSVATVSITVNPPPNNAPVANGNSYSTTKAVALTVSAPGILANDTDADGNPLTAVLASGPANGTLSLNANGSFTYTPSATFVGTDSFTYRASDGTTNSAAATVSITVNPPPNSAPVAEPDSYTVTKNVALEVHATSGVLTNDSDANTNDLTAVLVTGPAHGTLVLNPDGSFTYTPENGYLGQDMFTYVANDGLVNSAPATVMLTINPPPNTAPVAQADSYSTLKNTLLSVNAANGVLLNDTDVDGNPLAAVLVSAPVYGSVVLNLDGSLTYIPANNHVGADSFAYRAHDGTTNSAAVTVNITVVPPPNTAPVARGENYHVTRNTLLNIGAPGVLANDTDANADALSAILATGPAHGTVALNSDGSFTYTPVANYTGPDSFTYRAHDGTTNSATATVFITVNLPPNTAPVANPDQYATVKNTALAMAAAGGVLANDTDVDEQALSAVLVTPPAYGTVLLAPGGSFLYTPTAGFTGTDGFSYRANDGSANSGVAIVSITVNEPPPINVAPVATADQYTTFRDAVLSITAPNGVLANDTDANGATLTAALVTGPAHGTLSLNADGSFTYTPGSGFTGQDSFTYQANDGTNNSAVTVANLVVTVPPPVNLAPTGVADSYAALKDTPLYVSWVAGVLANDTDPEDDSIIASLVATPAHGTVTLNWNGGFVYVPADGFVGTDEFAYEADDGSDFSETTLVTITVSEPTRTNAVPVVQSDTYFTTRNTPLDVPATSGVLINDSDEDSTSITAALVFPPSHGVVTLNLDGSFTYEPAADFTGSDTFAYAATDDADWSEPTLVTISVLDDSTPTLGGCVNCFAALDEIMAERSGVSASAIAARQAVPTNSACPQYSVLVFRTLTRVLGPLHDSAANKALGQAAACVVAQLEGELALRQNRAASLAPSKYTTSASNYLATVRRNLDTVLASTNNSTRSKQLATAVNNLVRVDKALKSGDLAFASLEGRTMTFTFVQSGQLSRGTFVFGANTFVVEDSTGTPIKTGSFTYERTAWNVGVMNISFDQPTLKYEPGTIAQWTIKYGRTRHRLTAIGLRGNVTVP